VGDEKLGLGGFMDTALFTGGGILMISDYAARPVVVAVSRT
jgi:hypothetical protein